MALARVGGTVDLPIDPYLFWRSLLREDIIRACVPGCRQLRELEPGRYHIDLALQIGPIHGAYVGELRVVEQVEGRAYRLIATTTNLARPVSAFGAVDLEPIPGGTRVHYLGESDIPGLGRLVLPLVTPIARAQATKFFHCVAEHIAPDSQPPGS